MPIFALLIAAQAMPAAVPPACRAAQLRLSVDGRDGDFNGMSHAGTQLRIRNAGRDCLLPALPKVELYDAHGRLLPAARQAPIGMHPGPAMVPLRLAAGHSAAADLRWVSGPVYDRNRSVRAAGITVRIGKSALRVPVTAVLYGQAGRPVTFDQAPLQAVEGMAAG